MDDRFVLVRSDTHAALSIVSGDYQIVQPTEVLEFYRELMRLYGYTLETAGALDGGRKVWALAKTDISGAADDHGEDQLAAYILLAHILRQDTCHNGGFHQHSCCLSEYSRFCVEGTATTGENFSQSSV